MGYLTPETIPADTICRVLFIPNEPQWIANVTGALMALTLPEAWTPFGAVTPDEAAQAFMPYFDMFCFNEGMCRVIGEIIPYAGATSPDDRWLPCDGASLLRDDYPDLFAVIGTTYGAVDSDHFNLPAFPGRTPIGVGTGSGLTPRALGDMVGEETHTLDQSEMPSHSHSYGGTLLTSTVVPPPLDGLSPNPFPAATGNTGGDGAHNNMQPSLAINFLIVALP